MNELQLNNENIRNLYFVVNNTSEQEYTKIQIFINNNKISSSDSTVFLPSFIGGLKNELDRLKSKINYLKYQSYFKGKSFAEILEFILSTRDPESKNFDIEEDMIYPTHAILDWSEIFDHFSCFLVPFSDELYLGFHFWDIEVDITPDVQFVKITPYELIETLTELLNDLSNLNI